MIVDKECIKNNIPCGVVGYDPKAVFNAGRLRYTTSGHQIDSLAMHSKSLHGGQFLLV
jgi:hypothetical protein